MATFGEALEALKTGKIAYRQGWYGKELNKEMYIYCPIYTDPHYDGGATIETINTPTGMKELQPFTALVINQELIFGWLASQTDQYAEDWVIDMATDLEATDLEEADLEDLEDLEDELVAEEEEVLEQVAIEAERDTARKELDEMSQLDNTSSGYETGLIAETVHHVVNISSDEEDESGELKEGPEVPVEDQEEEGIQL